MKSYLRKTLYLSAYALSMFGMQSAHAVEQHDAALDELTSIDKQQEDEKGCPCNQNKPGKDDNDEEQDSK